MSYLKNPFILYGIIIFLFVLEGGTITYFVINKDCPISDACNQVVLDTKETLEISEEKKIYYVDIKGYVKKPGVYELEENAIVNDVIKLAGGLKSGGTTENINLSKKITDEMVIVVSSKTELNKNTSCVQSESNTTNHEESIIKQEESVINKEENDGKISINTATKEELMTLSGIGEKTADKIIEYRANKKFLTIEDIKNVSGIGDSLFEKIKDYITI